MDDDRRTELVRLALRPGVDAPGQARDALKGLPELEPVCEDALLVVSELVTNAIRHSGCGPDEFIKISAILDDQAIRIAVEDPGRSGQAPAIAEQRPPAEGGHGLLLVDQLASRWGVEDPDTRVVWAELKLL
ncbi:MAG: hypothetical protein NVSMB51_02250 [Solirubrobacteraceae bacterium]